MLYAHTVTSMIHLWSNFRCTEMNTKMYFSLFEPGSVCTNKTANTLAVRGATDATRTKTIALKTVVGSGDRIHPEKAHKSG